MVGGSVRTWLVVVVAGLVASGYGQDGAQRVAATHDKFEYMIPMRDGVKLYTAVYVPKNSPGPSPIMLERTPYSAGPYGPTAFKSGFRGSPKFVESGYIWAFQDV